MISLRNISFSYSDKKIFENFSLDIKANSTTVLVGKNGCGKTTLLNIVAGLSRISSGEMIFSKPNAKIAYAFSMPIFFPYLNILKNLALTSGGRSSNDIKKILNKDWKEFDINLNKFPNELSAGQKQIINLLRAFLFEPDIILLDEPTEHLDTKTKSHFIDFYQKNKGNKTCIWVSHNEQEVARVADEIVDLDAKLKNC